MKRDSYMRLAGTGAYLPRNKVSNEELKERYQLETSHEWIVERSGIHHRHLAEADETTAAMAVHSASQALERANCPAGEVDLVICATCTPDRALPSVAIEIHRELGCPEDCAAFDLAGACSGFIYALSVADSMMAAQPRINKILLACSERMSSIVNWQDRSTAVLFGDGAASVLLERGDEPGHYLSRIYAAGGFTDLLYTSPEDDKLKMQGRAVFRHAVAMMERLVDDLLGESGFERKDIDRLVPHQANSRIIGAVAKNLGLDDDQVVLNIGETGNTSAASIPIALDQGLQSGQIQQGQLIIFDAFGAGFVWGGSLMRC